MELGSEFIYPDYESALYFSFRSFITFLRPITCVGYVPIEMTNTIVLQTFLLAVQWAPCRTYVRIQVVLLCTLGRSHHCSMLAFVL
jgi:hypothetical protein